MDSNFVGAFRTLPFWPNNLIPLDEVLSRLLEFLSFNNIDSSTFQEGDPATLLGGFLGVNDINLYRYDGVTTVTGNVVVAAELVFSPFQSYVGIVIGKPEDGITTFPFKLRVRDETPIKNSDDVFFIAPNIVDPQLSAFTPVQKNASTGFLDIGSWELALLKIPAKIRLLKGVTRVEEIIAGDPGRGFRVIPNSYVDAGVELSLTFDVDGNLKLFPPKLTINDVDDIGNTFEEIDLGLFYINGSSWVLSANGLSYHHADDPFPNDIEVPVGLQQSWNGFMARQVGGFMAKVPTKEEDELHIYGITFENIFISEDVFSASGNFIHGLGANDPFTSTTPVAKEDLPTSRWSIRRIAVWISYGAGDYLQFGGQIKLAAILDWFNNQPVMFELSCGRVVKEIEGLDDPHPFVELTGSLAPVQNTIQPTPDGRLRLPLKRTRVDVTDFINDERYEVNAELRAVRFGILWPSSNTPGIDLHIGGELVMDVAIEIGETGEDPKLTAALNGLRLQISPIGKLDLSFEGGSLETNLIKPLDIFGYKFSISRISFGFDVGEDQTNWLGFDAHLEFPDTLGRADVFGMKYTWNSEISDFSISGIGIEVKKPTIEFAGIVRFLDSSAEFTPEGEEPLTIQPGSVAGFVKLAFPAATFPVVFQVGLMHGNYVLNSSPANERSFCMLSSELVFAPGLPLIFADLSFYGLSIAFGENVAPRKADNTPWFDWYAKEPPLYDVVAPTKWTATHGRSAYGLGVILGSQVRNGYPHNERALLLLNTAHESRGSTWIFDGKARFLKNVTASGKPNIALFAVFSPDEILFRAEFHFSFPGEENAAKGLVLTARAMIEVFNDKTGAGRHHVYLGQNKPPSKRINASILSGFFASRAFYMMDWNDLELSSRTLPPFALGMGFSQGWTLDEKYGPVRVYIEAGVEFEAGVSFAPAVYGFLRLYGEIGLKLYGYGFSLGLDASLIFFAADGWELTGSIRFKLNLPWPIPDYSGSLDCDWGPGVNPPAPIQAPVSQLALSSASQAGDIPVHEWSETNQSIVPDGSDPINSRLAVDGSIVLTLRVPVSNQILWISGVDTQPVDGSGEWKFRYTLTDLIITRRLPGTSTFEPLPNDRQYGFWEIDGMMSMEGSAPVDEEGPISQSIRIWGDTPGQQLRNLGGFERSGSVTWLDGFLDRYGNWPCGPNADLTPVCVHYDLPSFRLLDPQFTRATILPNGKTINSRTLFNPNDLIDTEDFFVVLDETVDNPMAGDWLEHEHALRLPYLYGSLSVHDRKGLGNYPILSGLDVDLPPSTEVTVTLLVVFPEEQFTVKAFQGETLLETTAPGIGSGIHAITLNSPNLVNTIDRIRIQSFNPGSISDNGDPAAVSALGSICFLSAEQRALDEHIINQRQDLDQLVNLVIPPTGEPGENADFFNLHAKDTEYRVTPVVTCERKGNSGGWTAIHENLQLQSVNITAGGPPQDLNPYLSETLPTYDQDPVYLGDDVILRFNRSFGPEMYTISGFDFRVEILDTDGQSVPIETKWQFSEEPALTPDQELLVEQLRSSDCINADLSLIRKKLEVVLRPVLQSRTRYQLVARSSAYTDIDLFEAPFSTSLYHSFSEQFNEMGNTVAHEMLPRQLDEVVFDSIIALQDFVDRDKENDALEIAWEDGLGMSFRERPGRGELTILYQSGAAGPGAPRVIILDSPEPLLVPQRTSLQASHMQSAGLLLKALRSCDGARTLLFAHDGQSMIDLLPGSYRLTATYLREAEGLPTQHVDGDSSPTIETLVLSVPAVAEIEIEEL